MTQFDNIAPIEELKEQARRLRSRLQESGVAVSHSKALELVAQQLGARDWNTLAAMAGNRPAPLRVGDRVQGRYLGQPFVGMIKALSLLGNGEQRRITLHFDEPVDVVKFDSFSSMRQRVSGTVGPDGQSIARTSDGVPQLIVARA